MRSLLVALFLLPGLALAQAPAKLSYQGRLLKSDGSPESGVLQVRFSLFSAASGGNSLWSEDQSLALSDGFYATVLGDTASLPGDLLDGSERYLEVSVGGSPLSPRQRLTSVPYALNAGKAASVSGAVEATSLSVNGKKVADSSGNLDFGALKACGSAGQILKWDGSAWSCATDAGGMTAVAVGAPLSGDGTSGSPITLGAASASAGGYLSKDDYAAFAAKLGAVNAAAPLSGNGTSGAALTLAKASAGQDGYLAKEDFAAFGGKLSSVAVSAPLSGSGAAGSPVGLAKASASADGYLAADDFKAFSDKVGAVSAGTGIAVSGQPNAPVISLGSGLTLAGATTFGGNVLFNSQVTKGFRVEMASSAPATCGASTAGYLYYNTASKLLLICDGALFTPIGGKLDSCLAIKQANPAAQDGSYAIDPDGNGPIQPFNAYCDMTTQGGGWTLVAKVLADSSVLNRGNTAQWRNRQYIGSIADLAAENALGKSYEYVAFTDVMIRSLTNASKNLGWRHPTQYPSVFSIVNAGTRISDGSKLFGSVSNLDHTGDANYHNDCSLLKYGFLTADYTYNFGGIAGWGGLVHGHSGGIVGASLFDPAGSYTHNYGPDDGKTTRCVTEFALGSGYYNHNVAGDDSYAVNGHWWGAGNDYTHFFRSQAFFVR